MDKSEELDLIKRAIEGGDEAFEALYVKYIKSIIYGARSWLYDKEAVEDVAQEIVLTMYKSVGNLKNPLAFKVWMQKIIRAVCVDENRKLKRGVPAESIDGFEEILEDDGVESQPEAAVDRKNADADLRGAIDALPDAQKRTLVLYYYEEMDYKEIAQALGVSKATVSTNLIKARNNLKDVLEKKGIAGMDMMSEERRGGFAAIVTSAIGANVDQVVSATPVNQILSGAGAKIHAYAAAHPAGAARSARSSRFGFAKLVTVAIVIAVIATSVAAIPRSDVADSPVAQPEIYYPSAVVVFAGGGGVSANAPEHINPDTAIIECKNGEDQVTGWRIEDGQGVTVAAGEGAEVTGAFANLSSGEYSIRWTLANADGQTAEVFRKFEIV
jgi:RNA polymerase sigma factor (sigma-70 family)